MASEMKSRISLSKKGRIAIIRLCEPKKLNALSQDGYYQLSCILQKVAAMPDVSITVLTGVGRYFSAGADVTKSTVKPSTSTGPAPDKDQERRGFLQGFVSNNLDVTRAFYTHPKILVTALNGPVVGLSAALVAWSDFIYATPHTFLLTPFSSLGLVTEGCASIGFVQRLGMSKAKEALIMSKRITSAELVQTGFVNKIFHGQSQQDDEGFLHQVLDEVDDRLGSHLNQESLLKIKELIHRPFQQTVEAQGVHEAIEGMSRLVSQAPQEEFRKIAAGEKRHKL